MTSAPSHEAPSNPFYWARKERRASPVAPGQDLAAMRRGLDQEPGSTPGMWPIYSQLRADGRLTASLRAEHHALGLFGIHQQSQSSLMHWPDVPIGEALRVLRATERYSEEALDRRVAQAATADDLNELSYHLRGLVTMLRTIHQGLDYTLLHRDLVAWQSDRKRPATRRRWGGAYFRSTGIPTSKPTS